MNKKTGEQIRAVFSVVGTAGLVNADALPSGVLFVNGVANGATVTVSNRSTGKYLATVTCPTLAEGDDLQLEITATVSSVAAANNVWIGVGTTKRVSELADVTAQGMRDAAKLAPTAGDPAAGSLDKHLDDILEDTGTTLPAQIAALEVIATAAAGTVLSNGALAFRRGDTITISLTGLGDITNRSKLWFTLKQHAEQTDDQSLLLATESAGLIRLIGVAATVGEAALVSLTVPVHD